MQEAAFTQTLQSLCCEVGRTPIPVVPLLANLRLFEGFCDIADRFLQYTKYEPRKPKAGRLEPCHYLLLV